MDKQKFVDEIIQKIPDGSKIIFAGITVLTEDFQTLNCTVEELESEEVEVI